MIDASLRELTCARWAEFNPDLDTSPMQVVAQIKRVVALLELAVEPIYADAGVTVAEVEHRMKSRNIENKRNEERRKRLGW